MAGRRRDGGRRALIVLDTNVVSELMRAQPHPPVLAWASTLPETAGVTTVITEVELRFGIARLPPGQKQRRLAMDFERVLAETLGGRVLPLTRAATSFAAAFLAARQASGRGIGIADGLIVGIARACDAAAIATRNREDFADCGIPVVNPWDHLSHT